MVECYFWVLGLYFEPQHFLARKILNQIFAFMITLDDIYDVYGTVEELVIFTDAIERLLIVIIIWIYRTSDLINYFHWYKIEDDIVCSGGI